jgi:hypothetical protein
MTTLTSCANTKVYFIPVQTGSAISGPYSDALNSNDTMNSSESAAQDYVSATDDNTGSRIGDDSDVMRDYLPSNYIYDSNNQISYGFSNFEKFDGNDLNPNLSSTG